MVAKLRVMVALLGKNLGLALCWALTLSTTIILTVSSGLFFSFHVV
jgi:hypothetical protein